MFLASRKSSNGDRLALLLEVLLNQLVELELTKHPVVVLLVDDFAGDDDLGVLSVELLLALLGLEDGHDWRRLLVQQLLAGLVQLIAAFSRLLKRLELVEFVDIVSVVSCEFLTRF